MAKFTIKDLAEGKCAVKSDGTVEELNKVLKAAFPSSGRAVCGDKPFYYKYIDGFWTSWSKTELPAQSVKDFLEELETPKLPKRGDRILVWSSFDGGWIKRIFIAYIEGAKNPIVCVANRYEKEFNSGEPFSITTWYKWKPIKKKVLEVTLEDVAKQFEVDEVKIVEKKG